MQTTIKNAFKHLDDLTSVAPNLWLYKPSKYVIEIFHDGTIRKMHKYKDQK
ncbi:hypothetical protein ACK8P5_10890 [Paenibacillus sp. EC2-1]|uniref:CDI toxin immunity protein n=1 Tax=Paenibacillus sp. EC2-1 TaxID=3388665 RepID=UPI003BEEFD51